MNIHQSDIYSVVCYNWLVIGNVATTLDCIHAICCQIMMSINIKFSCNRCLVIDLP